MNAGMKECGNEWMNEAALCVRQPSSPITITTATTTAATIIISVGYGANTAESASVFRQLRLCTSASGHCQVEAALCVRQPSSPITIATATTSSH